MAKIFKQEGYNWNYCNVGGVVRVNLRNGEDIANLEKLDQKKWTVLSCPTKGLHMDGKTLSILDRDADGYIHMADVVDAAKWLTSVIKDKDSILEGSSTLKLDNINTSTPMGEDLLKAARLVLKCSGKDSKSITMDEAEKSIEIFAASKFNGDGVIVEDCTDDENLKKIIAAVIACEGPVKDLSGKDGINSETLDKFLGDCKAYLDWQKAGEEGKASIFPYGDKTADAYAACKAVDAKIADYFMRCKLVRFDESVSSAVDISSARIEAIGAQNLNECTDEIASYPLARPNADAILDLDAINPAWQAAMKKAAALTGIDGTTNGITEEKWAGIMATFAPYEAYMASKAGAAVEGLQAEYIAQILEGNCRDALNFIIADDSAMAAEAAELKSINKLMHLYRDFYSFLNNYVVFSDFYNRGRKAIFEAGELYIDQRCCKLCIEVNDMGKHADMAGLSGMFLIYCDCTNKAGGKKQIAAVMTAGEIRNLRPGKNGIFYDLDGNDWNATITKVVDNPINIRNAFWAPYRKAANFVSDKIEKNVSAKNASSEQIIIGLADGKGKQAFDIAKFAGVFAAIGLALGFLMSAIGGLLGFVTTLSFSSFILLVIAVILVISGPSCFIAWNKLRKRNLGPVLNANGWAINSNVLVNSVFGATLTSTAHYPIVKGADPFKEKTPKWKKITYAVIAALVVAFGALYFTNSLEGIGLGYKYGDVKAGFTSIHKSLGQKAQEIQSEMNEAAQKAAEASTQAQAALDSEAAAQN